MFPEIAYQMFLGIPIVKWMGILTFIALTTTMAFMILTQKKIKTFPLKYHAWASYATIIFALVHLVLAL